MSCSNLRFGMIALATRWRTVCRDGRIDSEICYAVIIVVKVRGRIRMD